ncbi:hypothetical protein AB9F29_00230 [Falsihalocynthiibacter sp. S25ZX9]|uniref:hypothetical protein n=1 Tax=Falsihalocynthiibacter sp. S25ZX9 TaxID=3240870 RepID=UPI00350F08AA
MTLPDLISFNDYGGDWLRYEASLYAVFQSDILHHDLSFRGARVTARRNPEHERKWAGFWHLISEGRVEDDRLPDMRRCERLKWIRWIIENADSCQDIDVWENQRGSETSTLLWFREEYLVILSARSKNYLLKTAYCTVQGHKIRKLSKERDNANGTT